MDICGLLKWAAEVVDSVVAVVAAVVVVVVAR